MYYTRPSFQLLLGLARFRPFACVLYIWRAGLPGRPCRRDLCRSETGPGRTPCCGQFATRHWMLLELLLVATQLGGLAEPAGSGASPGTAALVPLAIFGQTWSHCDAARNTYERRIPLMIIHTKYMKRRLNMARGPPMWLGPAGHAAGRRQRPHHRRPARQRGALRVISDCHFAATLDHFKPYFRSYSVASPPIKSDSRILP